MSESNEEMGTVEGLKEAWNETAKVLKALGSEAVDFARDVADDVDEYAGKVVVKAEKIYDDYHIEDRLIGSGIGAKTGFLVTLRSANPFAIKAGVVFGTIAGAVYGREGMEKFRNWRDGHKEESPESGADAGQEMPGKDLN